MKSSPSVDAQNVVLTDTTAVSLLIFARPGQRVSTPEAQLSMIRANAP
jgi:hypothetical protein